MLEPLREQAQAGPIPEHDLDQIAIAAPEDEKVAGERILLQLLLYQQGQPVAPFRTSEPPRAVGCCADAADNVSRVRNDERPCA